MSPIACQGLQSCLQPRIFETNILIHNLSPPKSNLFQSLSFLKEKSQEKEVFSHNGNNTSIGICDDPNDNGGKLGGWNFIQTLCNTSNSTKQSTNKTEQVYIHPLGKQNSSTLSSNSLEMCTESLGSETGNNISENSDQFASMLSKTDKCHGTHRSKPREKTKKVEFPPPLSSISGTDSVQVRPRREGGRLVLEAVTLPPRNAYFHAERVDGRLRLSFLKDEGESDINEEENEGVVEQHESIEEGKVGCEIEVGEFHRLRRCKEGDNRKGITNCWEAFCLAIS